MSVALSSAISQALTGHAITWGGGGILETVEAETEVIYDLDLDEIDDGKQITEDNYLSKLIVCAEIGLSMLLKTLRM